MCADNGQPIKTIRRTADGYVNASALCESAGKRLSNYFLVESHRRHLRLLASSLGLQYESEATRDDAPPLAARQLVIKVADRPNGERATWVHPHVAEHIIAWASKPRNDQGKSGCVYVVSSPLTNCAKIGCWSGDSSSLWKRYQTYYGTEMDLVTAQVPDRRVSEKALHDRFDSFRIELELFDKAGMPQFVEAVKALRSREAEESKRRTMQLSTEQQLRLEASKRETMREQQELLRLRIDYTDATRGREARWTKKRKLELHSENVASEQPPEDPLPVERVGLEFPEYFVL